MYAPIATSLLVFMLLLNSSMNRRNLTTKSVLCENYEFISNLKNNYTVEEIANNIKTGKELQICNCTTSNSHTLKKSLRREIRELSFKEYSQMVNALWLSTDSLLLTANNITHECGIANFLDSILMKQVNLNMLMPYWNYKLDLALHEPTNSRIFHLISTYNKNDQLGTDFSDLAQIISEQFLLQRDQTLDDKIYKLLDNEHKWSEYKQAFELADAGDREDNGKILKLLLLVSIDIGVGYETDYGDYELTKNNCLKADNWLYWDEIEQKCQARQSCEELNCITNKLTYKNSNDSTFNKYSAIEAITTSENVKKAYNEMLVLQKPNSENYRTMLETIQLESSGEAINEQPILTNSETNILWPSFNSKINNNEHDQKLKQKGFIRKHRKHNKKINKGPSTIDINKSSEIFTTTKIISTQIPDIKKKWKKSQHKAIKNTKDYLGTSKSLKKHKNKLKNKEINMLKSYDSNALMEGVNDLDLLLPYLKKPKLPKGTIAWKANKTPFPVVYFTITIIDGPLSKRQRRPPIIVKNRKRTNNANIFLMGLNMPAGYTQITEGSQIKGENSALVRTLNPQTTGPFVEFKIRVENKYGTSCKQFCLDSNKRYKRCSRRIIRLSTYKKFSDPITFYPTANDAIDAQWTGRGYYRRRKFDYLLFRCD